MSEPVIITLMLFAAIGFAGAGVAFAVARAREVTEAETDIGMRAVALLLCFFGGSCVYVAAGLSAIFGFGAVIAWFAYVIGAHRLDVFRIERPISHQDHAMMR